MEFVFRCPNCQQVKVKHRNLVDLTQVIQILTWKWKDINKDFLMGFQRTRRKNDSIRVIVDRFTKFAYFIPVGFTYSAEKYARLYLKEIVRFNRIPSSIISDRGAQLTPNFSRCFHKGLGTHVELRTYFHPHTIVKKRVPFNS